MNPVHFVGAGPGAPDLITLRGRHLLDEAEVIVFAGSLVNPALLHGCRAEVFDSAGLDLEQIIGLIADRQRQGQKVVRLHTGDPSLYGAIHEQITRLEAMGIPCQVTPGVTAATAAAASLKTELTLPETSQTVILTRQAGRTPVPQQERIASLAQHQATMLIYLSAGLIDTVVEELRRGGYPDTTPVAVVEKASWPEEKTVRAPLGDIARLVRQAGIRKTAIIAVGEVLREGPNTNKASRLYDPGFTHAYRTGRQQNKEGL